MKTFIAAFLLLMLSLPAQADDAAWQTYTAPGWGLSVKMPPGWASFENVNTAFKAGGMETLFNACLTPGPVKTLSCAVDIYVVPGTFTPPKDGKFYGMTAKEKAGEPDTLWGPAAPFSISEGGSASDGTVTYYGAHNGLVFIWSQRASVSADIATRMRDSVVFIAPPGGYAP